MQWWNDFVTWLNSSSGQTVGFAAAVLFVAIIVSGVLAAWIARGAVRGLISRTDRERKAAAVAALVDAATEASVWNSLTPAEQVLSDRAVGQADILVRLLPIKGAGDAANWASHQLADLKRNSATFGYQLDPAIAEFRDRLIEWQNSPRRARKLFETDLEQWRFDSDEPAKAQQEDWVAREHHDRYAGAPTPGTEATAPTPAAPAVPATTTAESAAQSPATVATEALPRDAALEGALARAGTQPEPAREPVADTRETVVAGAASQTEAAR